MINHNLPTTWRRIKLKFLSRIRYGLGQPPAEMDGGLPLLRATNIDHGRIVAEGMIYVNPAAVPPDRNAFLRCDEILVVRSGAYTGDSAIVPTEYEGAVAGYDMVVHVVGAIPKYIAYGLLSIPVLKHQIDLCRMRAAQPHLNAKDLGDCLFAVPPLHEQLAIATFLDRKTDEIDAVIAKKERLIALLHEERQALISRAVTRGLDASVAMKDSGVEWLGSVPRHWAVERLKFCMRKIEQGWSPQCENRQAELGEWGVLKVGCMNMGVYDESENKALPPLLEPELALEVRVGDVLMSRSNTVELVGMGGIAHRTQERILLCDKLYRIVFDTDRLRPDYAVYLLRSRPTRLQIERDATGASSSMKNISNDTVRNLLFGIPPIEEQDRLIAHIRQSWDRIEQAHAAVQLQITKLCEYRQALISAAVTGKIAVPQEVAT